MENSTARTHIAALALDVSAGPAAPALRLRPWLPTDSTDLAAVFRDDDALRRWVPGGPHDETSALRWVRERRHLWETGDRFSFAVTETGDGQAGGRLLGQVVLKRGAPGGPSAEIGYWTAAHARGRGVAPRAVRTVTDWAFTAFPEHVLTQVELVHQVDNTASCRVADKCGYVLDGLLPPCPPAFPLDGHRHVRVRDDEGRSGGASGTGR